MSVSIVIPAYNASATIEACVRAAMKQAGVEVEVIVVNDGSSDDTPRRAERLGVMVISRRRGGPAAARNAGARVARGEIVAFTDADCIPHLDWVQRLLEQFGAGVAGVGGSYGIANPDSWLARMIHEEIAWRHSRFEAAVDYLGSFNVAYRRDLFLAIGGFNEEFRSASGEDNDLAYRLHDEGYTLRFAPQARVDHYHPERLGRYLRTQMNHGFWRMKLLAIHGARRAGDHYAGRFELLGLVASSAGLGLAVILAIASLVAPETGAAILGIAAAIVAVSMLFHTPVAVAIMRRSGELSAIGYVPVLLLRSLARTLGMLRGAMHFLVLNRRTIE